MPAALSRRPVVVLLLATLATAGPAAARELQDLHFGEALYYAHQERYFDALQRLDPELSVP